MLDTTDPAAIGRLARELPADRTVHVAASKSGSTLETRSHLAWAWERHPDPAGFAVITDPGSELAALAAERGFADTFENPPDIGGRYSALSLFGLVPALLAGADVEGLLGAASAMSDRLRASAAANPAARLAATVAAGVREGRDKLTIVVPDGQATFGLWLEQLLAESTGKDGTGVVPVVGEPLAGPDAYGDDRLFVALGDDTRAGELDALAEAGHPVTVVPFGGAFVDLGGQVLLWELATAWWVRCSASSRSISPTWPPPRPPPPRCWPRARRPSRPRPSTTCSPRSGPATTWRSRRSSIPAAPRSPPSSGPGSPCATGCVATTVGLGPRFLHSTGQLHKGGPATGVFVQVVGDDPDDVPIPGAAYGFSTLKHAQADGDLVTLLERGRRAGGVKLSELVEVAP